MSIPDQEAAKILTKVALAGDGAVLGVVLAYISVRSLFKFSSNSSALKKIQNAPSLPVSDLRSLLDSGDDGASADSTGTEKLVIVRGVVEARSAVNVNWKNIRPNVLVSHESEKAVILQRTQTVIYNEWRGLFRWTSGLRSLFRRSLKEPISTLRTVPFVLIEGGRWPQSDFVIVNLDGSKHPLPLTTVYHNLRPVTHYTFLEALFSHEVPVGFLDEEKILPLGEEITALGICRLNAGTPEIKSCEDLPFFLSDMSKDQMVLELAFRSKILLWSGVVIGSLAIGVLGYAVVRNWNRLKEWKNRRQIQQAADAANIAADAANIAADEEVVVEETEDVPDGELCVICLTRRRRTAFSPCGHLVCCPRCAFTVEREESPKCPVCRQSIHNSLRIFEY